MQRYPLVYNNVQRQQYKEREGNQGKYSCEIGQALTCCCFELIRYLRVRSTINKLCFGSLYR